MEIPSTRLGKRRMICEGLDAKGTFHNYVDSEANGENGLEHPHNKQLTNVVAWLVGVMNDHWYIKPRSTHCFDKFLFDMYTLDQFYPNVKKGLRSNC